MTLEHFLMTFQCQYKGLISKKSVQVIVMTLEHLIQQFEMTFEANIMALESHCNEIRKSV